MKLWPLICAILSLFTSPAPALAETAGAVARIQCHHPLSGSVVGTAWYYLPHLLITAAHVTDGRFCIVGSWLAPTVYQDTAKDIAVVYTQDEGPARIPISCEQPRRGVVYSAEGWPGGARREVRVFEATGLFIGAGQYQGQSVFWGAATPGMSGSPIIRDGKALGILTAGSSAYTFSRLLRDTFICTRRK